MKFHSMDSGSNGTLGVDHPNGDFGFKDSAGQTITQYDVAAGSVVEVIFLGDESAVRSFSFNASGDLVATGCTLVPGDKIDSMKLSCANPGKIMISLTVTWRDDSTETYTKQITVITPLPQPSASPGPSSTPLPLIINFSIANGTGTGPWNTTPVLAFVGQTVKITNNDTQVHQLHTGGKPCGHAPSPLSTGGTYDCVISQVHSNPNAGDTYDHLLGTGSPFLIKTLNGTTLYNNTNKVATGDMSCVDCHGALPGPKHGRTFAQIKTAIAQQPAMMVLNNLKMLSDDEIHAIEFALSQ